jgi:hypothetical protein
MALNRWQCTCLVCGKYFAYGLGIHYKNGYICAACYRGNPLETSKPIVVKCNFSGTIAAQTKLVFE